MKATAPDGTSWRIARRWIPRYEGRGLRARLETRRRRRRRDGDSSWMNWIDLPAGLDDLPGGVVAVVLLVVAAIVLVVLGLPVLLALVDLIVVVLVAAVGVVSRVLFRRPWTVEARAGHGERHVRRVVGWRRSRDSMAAMRGAIEAGLRPGDTDPTLA